MLCKLSEPSVAANFTMSAGPPPPLGVSSAPAAPNFRRLSSIPIAFYRSGTSRGLFLLESDLDRVLKDSNGSREHAVLPRPVGVLVPRVGGRGAPDTRSPDGAGSTEDVEQRSYAAARDRLIAGLMGSGHAQQLEGFGGGVGVTSKVVVVGRGGDATSVTYSFFQCNVRERSVDRSHGDCGNMIAAVGSFALERGLVRPLLAEEKTALPSPPGAGEPDARTDHADAGASKSHRVFPVRIRSLVTGAEYIADVPVEEDSPDKDNTPCYDGTYHVPGTPSSGAPVQISTLGVAGAQTGTLLPLHGLAVDSVTVDTVLPWRNSSEPVKTTVRVSVVDFARALIVLDGHEVLEKLFGEERRVPENWASDETLNQALESVRRTVSLRIGMGDCTAERTDAPKVAVLFRMTPFIASGGERTPTALTVRYWVNPLRAEVHPSCAMTAAQAIAACCVVRGSVAWGLCFGGSGGREEVGFGREEELNDGAFSMVLEHPLGQLPVTVGTDAESRSEFFPFGKPYCGRYCTTVRPIAEGRAFL